MECGRCRVIRSVRKVVAGSERKANSKEEDDDQEMYAKPVLQRVVQLRSSVRTDTGRELQNNYIVELYGGYFNSQTKRKTPMQRK